MSGVTGYPRTTGTHVPADVLRALVAAGHLTTQEADEFASSPSRPESSGTTALRAIVKAMLKDRRNDAPYLDRVNAALLDRQQAREHDGSPSSTVIYHYSGARELAGFRYQAVDYEKKFDRDLYGAERDAFDKTERRHWIKEIAVTHRHELLAAGITPAQVDGMARKGWPPDGYQVHHRIPLDDGGTNHRDNFILIRDNVEHRALHGYYNPAELRIRTLKPGESAKVALAVPPTDTVIYPNPAKGYVSKTVSYSRFLRVFDVD